MITEEFHPSLYIFKVSQGKKIHSVFISLAFNVSKSSFKTLRLDVNKKRQVQARITSGMIILNKSSRNKIFMENFKEYEWCLFEKIPAKRAHFSKTSKHFQKYFPNVLFSQLPMTADIICRQKNFKYHSKIHHALTKD